MSKDLKKADLAGLALSIEDKMANIHFRLKAELEPIFDFDIDEQCSIGIVPQPKIK